MKTAQQIEQLYNLIRTKEKANWLLFQQLATTEDRIRVWELVRRRLDQMPMEVLENEHWNGSLYQSSEKLNEGVVELQTHIVLGIFFKVRYVYEYVGSRRHEFDDVTHNYWNRVQERRYGHGDATQKLRLRYYLPTIMNSIKQEILHY